MSASPQTQAIQNANTIISLAAQLLTLSQSITQVNNAWQDQGSANVLNAMATRAAKTDGTLGTADVTPNNANPIDIGAYITLNRAISSNTLAAMLTVLNNIPTYVAGSAVAATSGVRAICNQATGG